VGRGGKRGRRKRVQGHGKKGAIRDELGRFSGFDDGGVILFRIVKILEVVIRKKAGKGGGDVFCEIRAPTSSRKKIGMSEGRLI